MSRPFTAENLLVQAEFYFLRPYITPRELYPLMVEKQFNLITQLINKNVILKIHKVRDLEEKSIIRAFKVTGISQKSKPDDEDSDGSLNHQAMKQKYRI